MELEEARNRAFNKFKKLQNIEILCPALGVKIKFNRDGFYHIVYKNSKHKRGVNEQIIRFQCFLDVEEIIKKSHLYQEYAVKTEEIKTRNHGQNKLEKKIVEYFGLVGVIVHNNEKSRVRVVLRNFMKGLRGISLSYTSSKYKVIQELYLTYKLNFGVKKKEKVRYQINQVRCGANTTNFFCIIIILKIFLNANLFGQKFFFCCVGNPLALRTRPLSGEKNFLSDRRGGPRSGGEVATIKKDPLSGVFFLF